MWTSGGVVGVVNMLRFLPCLFAYLFAYWFAAGSTGHPSWALRLTALLQFDSRQLMLTQREVSAKAAASVLLPVQLCLRPIPLRQHRLLDLDILEGGEGLSEQRDVGVIDVGNLNLEGAA